MELKFFFITIIILIFLFIYLKNNNILETFTNREEKKIYDLSGYYSIHQNNKQMAFVSINKISDKSFILIYNNNYGVINVEYRNNSHEIHLIWFINDYKLIKHGFKNGSGYIYKNGNEFILNTSTPNITYKKSDYRINLNNIVGKYIGEENKVIVITNDNDNCSGKNNILNCKIYTKTKIFKGFFVIGKSFVYNKENLIKPEYDEVNDNPNNYSTSNNSTDNNPNNYSTSNNSTSNNSTSNNSTLNNPNNYSTSNNPNNYSTSNNSTDNNQKKSCSNRINAFDYIDKEKGKEKEKDDNEGFENSNENLKENYGNYASTDANNKSYYIYIYLQDYISNKFIVRSGELINIGNHYQIRTHELGNWIKTEKIIVSNIQESEDPLDIRKDYNSISLCLNRNKVLLKNTNNLTSIRDKRYTCRYTSKKILNNIKNTIMYFPVENNTIFNKIVGGRNAIGILLKNSDFNLIKDDLLSPNFIDIYNKTSIFPMCTLLPCNNKGDICKIKGEHFSKIGILKDQPNDSIFIIKAINDVCNINHKKKNKIKKNTNNNKMNCNQICLDENANCTEARLNGKEQVSCNITPKFGEIIACKCLKKRKDITLEKVLQDTDNNKSCRKVCLSKGLTCSNLVEIENGSHRFRQCNIQLASDNNNNYCICHNSGENIESIDIIRSNINKRIDNSKLSNIVKDINPDDYFEKSIVHEGYKDICDGKYLYLKINSQATTRTLESSKNKNSCNYYCSKDANCDAWTFDNNTNKCIHYKYNISSEPHKYRCKPGIGPFYQGEHYGKVKKNNSFDRRNNAIYHIEPECKAINNPNSEWENSYELSGINSPVWGNLKETHFFKGDNNNKEAKWIWTSSFDVVSEVTFKYKYCSYKPHGNATLNICIDNTGYFKINDSNRIETSGGWSGGTGRNFNIVVKQGINNIKIVARNLGISNNHAGLILTVLGDDKEYLFSTNKDWLFKERLLCNVENNVGTAVHIVGQNGRTQIAPWNKGTEFFSQDAKWIWNNQHGGTWSPAAPANVYITFRYKFCYPKKDINAKLFVIIDNTTSPNGYIKFNNNSITNDKNGSLHWTGGWGAVCNSNDKNNIMSGGRPSCNVSYGKVLIKKGANTIEVKCRNIGGDNNPAGFIISCFDIENNNIFNTNKDWKVISTEGYYPYTTNILQTNYNDDSLGSYSGGHFKYLDRHNVDCGRESGLNYFRLERGSKPRYNTFRYNYKCKGNPDMRNKPNTDMVTNYKQPVSFGRIGGTENLKYHRMHCPNGVISQFKLQSEDRGNNTKVRYNYRCKNLATKNCEIKTLPYKYHGNGNLVFLDRQIVGCPNNKMIKSIKYESGPTTARYIIQCCDHHTPSDPSAEKDKGTSNDFEDINYPARAFQHKNYGGWEWNTATVGSYNLNGGNNDNISSLKVAPGYEVILYKHYNKSGHNVKFTSGNYPWIPDQGFPNDQASTIEVIKK